jgi:hypothetical protein
MIQSAAGNTLVHMAEGMAKSSEIIVMEMLEFIQSAYSADSAM